jgi:hypothetical protein
VIAAGLGVYGVLSHVTAVQRMRRAVGLLRAADDDKSRQTGTGPE